MRRFPHDLFEVGRYSRIRFFNDRIKRRLSPSLIPKSISDRAKSLDGCRVDVEANFSDTYATAAVTRTRKKRKLFANDEEGKGTEKNEETIDQRKK